MLSKSQFIRGLQCHKSLWLYRHRPEERTPPSPYLQAIFDRGTNYGLLAQDLIPGGTLVPFDGLSYQEQVEKTQQLIAAGVETIYEATFLYEDMFVKVDIFHRGPGGWELYEVKSSFQAKDVYVNDIAVQFYTSKGTGTAPVRAVLVLMNEENKGRLDLPVTELFRCVDVTAEVQEKQAMVVAEIARQKMTLSGDEPQIVPGGQCHRPYGCDFRKYCTK